MIREDFTSRHCLRKKSSIGEQSERRSAVSSGDERISASFISQAQAKYGKASAYRS